MDESEVWGKLGAVITGVFGHRIELSRTTTAKEVADWDSLRHVLIIAGVEEAFNIRFSSAEMDTLQTVGDFVDLIRRKTAAP